MKAVIALCVILAVGVHCGVVPAATLVRTPSLDSAIIKSDRLGGSFAYSTVEGHAYTAISPVVQRVSEPVEVSYTAHQVPLGFAHTPVAVSQPIIAQQSIVSQPILAQHQHLFAATPALLGQSPIYTQNQLLAQAPILAQNPVWGGIAQLPQIPSLVQQPIAQAPTVAEQQPIAEAPALSPAPVQGNIVDDDTVAVESA